MRALSKLYRGQNDYDFPRVWRFTSVLSLVLVLVSITSFFVNGLNLSLDFEGGSVWEVPAAHFSTSQAEDVLANFGPGAGEKFQQVTLANGDPVLRITGRVDNVDEGAKVAAALAKSAGVDQGEVTVNTVGPSWGEDITRQAKLSLVVFMVLVAAYIAWRLETRMAIAAMIAVVHDIIVTVGVYSVFQLEVTPATVISFLTILGFSLYDTIVVYDRVQENASRIGRSGQYTYTGIMRRSLNQVFMRSINTTIVTLLPVASMLILGQFVFGQKTLGDFSLALLIGLLSGAYSSLFVAAPLTVWMKEREPRFREIRSRLVARGVDVKDTAWHGIATGRTTPASVPRPSTGGTSRAPSATAAAEAPSTGAVATETRPSVQPGTFGGHPPRPRKKKKRSI